MKKYLVLLLLTCAASAFAQSHQMEVGYPKTKDYQHVELREAFSFSKKLPANFDISIEEELREVLFNSAADPVAYFSKSYTTVGLGYKLLSKESLNTGYKYGLKLDLGYTLKFNAQGLRKAIDNGMTGADRANKCLQHRPFVALTASATFGNWKLSVKETYRVNFRFDSIAVADRWNPEILVYENNPQLMELRSRLRLEYSFFGKPIKLFTYGEVLNTLNEKACPWLDKEGQPIYSGQYLSGARASFGVKWRFDKFNALSFSYLYSFKQNRDININRSRQNVELTWERIHTHALVIAYEIGY